MIIDKLIEKQTGKKLDKPVKTLITIGEIVIIYKVGKGIYDGIKADKKKRDQEKLWQQWYAQQGMTGGAAGFPPAGLPAPGGTTPQTTNIPAPGGGLSYAPTTYAAIADALEAAMNTSGTDESEVETQMKKIKTLDDYLAVDNAFGERTNYVFGFPAYTADLAYWINDEMGGSSEVKNINKYFTQRGIPVQI